MGLKTVFAVAPLDDNSVCLWDVTGAKMRKGAIWRRSEPGILHVDNSLAASHSGFKGIDSGVTECVSVDSKLHLAFFAVHCHLIQVDLGTLTVVGCESYPRLITALSSAESGVPLTVASTNGIHPFDHRCRTRTASDEVEKLDTFGGISAQEICDQSLEALFNGKSLPPCVPFAHPAPLSILHMQRPGAGADIADEVYIGGRFPSILLYDRRMFSSIQGSIHSGAMLSNLTSMPTAFLTATCELRREAGLSSDQVGKCKTTAAGGRTLLACGEYKTKGSFEMYGLQPSSPWPASVSGGLTSSVLRNRQSSNSKLMSIITQGTRLVVSDGSGRIKWFESDGFTEVLRTSIGHCKRAQGPSLLASMPDSDWVARKLVATQGTSDNGVNGNDVLFWTGERLGMVTFRYSRVYSIQD